VKLLISVLFVCILVPQCLSAQGPEPVRLDERIAKIERFEKEGNLLAAAGLAEQLVNELNKGRPTTALGAALLDRLASLRQDLGSYVEAQHLYETAVQSWQSLPGAPGNGLATEWNNLASLYSATGQLEKAEALRRQSLALRLQLFSPDHPEIALSRSNLAADLFRQGKYAEAEQEARSAVEIWDKGRPDQNRADLALDTLALIKLHEQDATSAIQLAQFALSGYQRRQGNNARERAEYVHTLALAEEYGGDWTGAAKSFEQSLNLLQPGKVPAVMRIGLLEDYSRLLRRTGQKRKAGNLHKQATEAARQLARRNSFLYTVGVNALHDVY
jgi:tetratricopeptide (TPR) repeat protein